MFFIPNVLSSGSEENQPVLFVEISLDHLEDCLLITTLLNRLYIIRYLIALIIVVFVILGNKFEDFKRKITFFFEENIFFENYKYSKMTEVFIAAVSTTKF